MMTSTVCTLTVAPLTPDANPQAYMAYRREGARIPRAARNAARDALPPGGDRIFGVGQHKGLSFEEVLHRFPGYVIWGR